jgi:hypothetical protein
MLLKGIPGNKGNGIVEGWKKQHNEESHSFFSAQIILRIKDDEKVGKITRMATKCM